MIKLKAKFRRKTLPLLMMISPAAVWLFLLVAVPLFYVLAISFLSTDETGNVTLAFTLKNYIRLFDPAILGIYVNSLIVSVITTLICILLAYPFAYIMSGANPFKKTMMFIFLLLPFWTNSLIRLYSWRTLLGAQGYVNKALLYIGVINAPIEMMFTRGAVILGMVYTLLPFMVLPIFTVVDKLDDSLIEASKDLGAGFWKTFRYITLPLTAPGIFAGSIMVFIPSLGYFFVSDLMGGGNNQIIGSVISRQFKEAYNWPFGAALSIMLIVLTLFFVKLYTKSGGKLDDLGTM